MCGCMLMHATMNHEEQRHPALQPASAPMANVLSAPGARQCPHCNFPLQQGFAFCPNCGLSLRTAECEACGQKVEPRWKACAYCGSPLGQVERQPAQH